MRIMVVGDSASGKSTFANKLGKKLSIPVIHLDEVMDEMGREGKESIRTFIKKQVEKECWIIEGNAFTKDKEERIKATDLMIVFDFNPIVSFYNHVKRYVHLKTGMQQKRMGSSSTDLNLSYFIPYIFLKFPKRKREAIRLARSHDKNVIIFKSRKAANNYLLEM